MFVIDGPLWFIGALIVCGLHALHLRAWLRERKAALAWWQDYDTRAKDRHEEFMRVMGAAPSEGWNLDGGHDRGQA